MGRTWRTEATYIPWEETVHDGSGVWSVRWRSVCNPRRWSSEDLQVRAKHFYQWRIQDFQDGGASLLLPAATKLWPRLCFYTCLWFCQQGGFLRAPPPPPGPSRPPLDQADTPQTRQTPPGQGRPPLDQADPPPPGTRQTQLPPTPPGPGRTPPREEDCSIRSMSGRYASYWNAFDWLLYT